MMCLSGNSELLFYCDSSLQIQLCELAYDEVGIARSSSSYHNVHTVSALPSCKIAHLTSNNITCSFTHLIFMD